MGSVMVRCRNLIKHGTCYCKVLALSSLRVEAVRERRDPAAELLCLRGMKNLSIDQMLSLRIHGID
jgi:hypothetical protein